MTSDPQAFGLIFDMYYEKILAYAVRRTNNVIVAEDIVNKTFVKAHHGLPKLRQRTMPIEIWLFKIVVKELRARTKRKPRVQLSSPPDRKDGYQPFEDQGIIQEAKKAQAKLSARKQFMRAQVIIQGLPAVYQDILLLHLIEQKKNSEIAQILGKKERTIESLLSKALFRLHGELSGQKMQPIKPRRIINRKGDN